ncbi:MAG TPA: hypothetical protein VNO35_35600 [Steroidobacteraceae bacterium]|nr:hypothetical protein [Steroidobacteraceae bacterium]
MLNTDHRFLSLSFLGDAPCGTNTCGAFPYPPSSSVAPRAIVPFLIYSEGAR